MTIKLTSPKLLIGSLAVLLASCSTTPTTTPVTSPTAPVASTAAKSAPNVANKGGQVVESGKYHLELVPEKSASETHLDLFVQKGDNHQDIPDAKISGEIQLPDGQQKTISFIYDAAGNIKGVVVSLQRIMGSNI